MKLEKLSQKEKDEWLKYVFDSPYFEPYIALRKQQDSITKQISETEIKFGAKDDVLFDSLLKWVDKTKKLAETLEYYRERLNPQLLKEAEKRVTQASPVQLESRVKNKQSSNDG